MKQRYFDNFTIGERFTSRALTVTEEDIVQFAEQFDPQPFHLDNARAETSLYKGLIASGFHTVALCFRLFVESGELEACSMGSPGIDELRWLKPVRPGDQLKTNTEVIEIRPSSSKPDRGILRMRYEALNQQGRGL